MASTIFARGYLLTHGEKVRSVCLNKKLEASYSSPLRIGFRPLHSCSTVNRDYFGHRSGKCCWCTFLGTHLSCSCCHSFVSYINAVFRFYIWHLNSQPAFFLQYPVRTKVVDSLNTFKSFWIFCWHQFNHQRRQYDPNILQCVCGGRGGGGNWVQRLPNLIGFQLGFRQLDF